MGRIPRGETGFTIIEVLVASLVLAVGIGATLGLVAGASRANRASKEVEGATNLARELTERVRGLSYDQLTSANAATQLQANGALATTTSGAWTVSRRGMTYTIDLSICSVDDPKDDLGAHDGATFCPDSTATGTADLSPQDFKRATATVSWTAASGATRRVRQSVVLNAKGADGPPVTAIGATTPAFPDPAAPVVSNPATSSVIFQVTGDPGTNSVTWTLDGQPQGTAQPSGDGTTWSFAVDVSSLPDRTYELSASAVDARGVEGPAFTVPLVLNRYVPGAPTGVTGGRNTVYVSGTATPVAEVEWLANPEVSVVGYRVYRPDGTRACPGGATTIDPSLTCVDTSPQNGQYEVAAIYRDSNNAIQETAHTKTAALSSATSRSYFFKNMNSFGGQSGCATTDVNRDLDTSWTGGARAVTTMASGIDTFRLCSPVQPAGLATTAGTAKLSVNLQNRNTAGCDLTPSVEVDGTTWLTGAKITIPASEPAIVERTWSWSIPVTSLAGKRVAVLLAFKAGTACDQTDVVYNDTTYRSRLDLPGSSTGAPDPPTGLTGTATADGLKLDWVAPSSGPTPAFYRIYRDGYDLTRRYDRTGDAATTYTDPDRTSGSHTYYVTAVTANLTESTPVPLAPASFP